MYGFEPTDEQRMLVEAVQRFAQKEMRPVAHDADEAGELPPALIEKGWELGLLQASIPEGYGGFGERSAVTGVLAAEELGWGDLSAALAVLAPNAFALPVLAAGTEEQKRQLIPPVIGGEWKPFVAAFVEPDFDFYPGEMRTSAAAQNGGYVLNGVKALVPYAEQAQSFLVFAAQDGRIQAFVVPAGTPGLTIAGREKLLGLQAIPTYRLQLKDVKAEARLGGEQGMLFEPILASSQVALAGLAVGLSRGAFEYARDYAKEREAFGGPIAQKQSIAFTLADMAMMVTDRAVQILGGHGYIREHPVERWMRNARGVASYVGLAMV